MYVHLFMRNEVLDENVPFVGGTNNRFRALSCSHFHINLNSLLFIWSDLKVKILFLWSSSGQVKSFICVGCHCQTSRCVFLTCRTTRLLLQEINPFPPLKHRRRERLSWTSTKICSLEATRTTQFPRTVQSRYLFRFHSFLDLCILASSYSSPSVLERTSQIHFVQHDVNLGHVSRGLVGMGLVAVDDLDLDIRCWGEQGLRYVSLSLGQPGQSGEVIAYLLGPQNPANVVRI